MDYSFYSKSHLASDDVSRIHSRSLSFREVRTEWTENVNNISSAGKQRCGYSSCSRRVVCKRSTDNTDLDISSIRST